MREIKFRCWGEESKKWFYYDEIQGRHSINPDQKCSISYMFTGLKDKNGREIFEGDFVKHYKLGDHDKKDPITGKVLFSSTSGVLVGNWPINIFDCEVLGNIYENPELSPSI